jgi:hypothetical protein
MHDHLHFSWQRFHACHELGQLVERRQAAFLNRNRVDDPASSTSGFLVILWRLLLLVQEREDNAETIGSKLGKLFAGGITGSHHQWLVDPPSPGLHSVILVLKR